MKKIFAIGTLLLSSAAVFASPAAAYVRNDYGNYNNHVRIEEKAREDARLRDQRLERERRERELREVRYEHSRWDRY